MHPSHTQTIPTRSNSQAAPHNSPQQTVSLRAPTARESPAPADPCQSRSRQESTRLHRSAPPGQPSQKRAASPPTFPASAQTAHPTQARAAIARSQRPAPQSSRYLPPASATPQYRTPSRYNPPPRSAAPQPPFSPCPAPTQSAPASPSRSQ